LNPTVVEVLDSRTLWLKLDPFPVVDPGNANNWIASVALIRTAVQRRRALRLLDVCLLSAHLLPAAGRRRTEPYREGLSGESYPKTTLVLILNPMTKRPMH